MSAYRLYSKASPDQFEITLAHGYVGQEPYPLFRAQHLIHPMTGSAWSQYRFITAGRRWLDRHWREFDVFHGLQGFELTASPAWHAHQLGLPAVVKLAAHQSDLADKQGWKRLLALPRRRRERLKQIGAVIAISKAIADELREYGFPEEKIAQIPNGVDTDQFRPVASSEERELLRAQRGWRNVPTILFVGGLVRRKRPHLLVEAMGLLKQQGHDCQLVLAGPEHEPEYSAELRRRIESLGLSDRVVFEGFTADVSPLYRASDIFSLPSANEGMPNAVLEAMASGLPTVVTAISGTIDLVRHGGTGQLVEADTQAITEAIRIYLDQPGLSLQHGQAGRQVIEEHFSAAAVLKLHQKLFLRIRQQ